MREILFRGKRGDNGEWVEGYYAKWQNEDVIFPVSPVGRMRKVHPETVGQFTGLFDKNGKKIFEGDVLDLGQTVNGCSLFSVEWDNNRIGWSIRYHIKMNKPRLYEYSVETFFMVDQMTGEGVEIIGNIHDSPELLK